MVNTSKFFRKREKNKLPELTHSDYRRIIKFDKNNVPYEYILRNVPGINIITEKLKGYAEQGISEPIIIAGDIAGMGDFNNDYGRETADGVIEKALAIFIKEIERIEGIAGSPSGDEMWALPPQDIDIHSLVDSVASIIRKFNTSNIYTGRDIIGLNAKFYIGRKSFADVESLLKYYPGTKRKLPPGTILIEGALLGRDSDMILQPKELSNETIIRKISKQRIEKNKKKSREIRKKRYQGRKKTEKKEEIVYAGQAKSVGANLDYDLYDSSITYKSEINSDNKLSGDFDNSGLEIKYRQNGYFYFPEEKINSPNDIAFAFQQVINEAVERFYIIGVKDNSPIFVEPVSIGNINCSIVSAFEPLHLLLQKNADSLYMLHNHPSNSSDPSENDLKICRKFIEAYRDHNIDFKGHLVMGYSSYSFIDSELKSQTFDIPDKLIARNKVSQLTKYINRFRDTNDAFVIDKPESLLKFARSLNVELDSCTLAIYADSRLRPICTELIPNDRLAARHIAESAVGVRSPHVFLVNTGDKTPDDYRKLQKKLNNYPIMLHDVINFNGYTEYSSAKEKGLIQKPDVQYDAVKYDFDRIREEKLCAVRNSIEIKKSEQGFIADNDPLVVELKEIQRRSGNSDITRRTNEQRLRKEILPGKKRDSLKINNISVLEKLKSNRPLHDFYKEEMAKTTRSLIERKNLSIEKKKEVAKFLNSDRSEIIWRKISLEPESRTTAAMILIEDSGTRELLDDVIEKNKKIIKDICTGDMHDKQRGLAR